MLVQTRAIGVTYQRRQLQERTSVPTRSRQSTESNFKNWIISPVENSLCVGLPGCRRSPSLGCLARKWRQKILSRKWNIFRRRWHKSHQIRRLQFQRYIQPLFQTYEGPLHLSVIDRFSVCGSAIMNDTFSKTYLLTRRATKGPTSWMVPARIPPKSSFALIGTRNVWSCARDVKSKYL